MTKRQVIFRADGSAEVGLGHLFRSAALAAMLIAEFDCILAYHCCPPSVLERFSELYTRQVWLATGTTEEVIDLAQSQNGAATVILDGYNFDTAYQQTLLDAGIAVVCIDDIHAYHFAAKLVINHAPLRGGNAVYKVGPHSALALGPEYSLLRPSFLKAARLPTPTKRKGFFICFGGADPSNITGQLIHQLASLGVNVPLTVVLGTANLHRQQVEESAKAYPGEVKVHENISDAEMIEGFRQAVMAFLPASTVMMEALATGVPLVGGFYVDNQVNIYQGWLDLEVIEGVGDWNAPAGLEEAISNVLRKVGEKPNIIDGYSHLNLRQAIRQVVNGREDVLLCRRAGAGDVRQYFEWANDASVRLNSIQQKTIEWPGHEGWFQRSVTSLNALMLIFYFQNEPCGQLRYEIEGRYATLGFSVAKEMRGRGLSRRMLELAEEQLRERRVDVQVIVAMVRLNNTPSEKAFRKNGYTMVGIERIGDVELLRFEKGIC